MSEVIERYHTVRDLGFIMSDDGEFCKHIEKVEVKARKTIGWIFKTFQGREINSMRYMWNTYVQPHIDYSSQLYSPYKEGSLVNLESLLK